MAFKERKRKKRKLTRIEHLLHYLALRVVVVLLHTRTVEENLELASFLGRCLWRYYERGRTRATDNLRASYPDKSDDWIERVGMRSFEQIVMLTVDILYTPRIVRRSNWKDYADFKNIERVKWMLAEKRGMIMATAHYGNFEIIGYMLGLFGFDIYSVARPLDNPYVNSYLYGVRERMGQRIIDKKGAARLMPDILADGSALGFIADQDAGRKGIFVDFFGRKASTYKSIGLLALTNDLPIAVGYARRIGKQFRFEIACNRLIMPEEWRDKEDALQWVSQEYSNAIEEFIREDPSQYWWVHRRWKTRPKEEQKLLKAGKKAIS